MDVARNLLSCEDDNVSTKFENAIALLKRAFALYSPSGVALSFNGGKDSTVLLHILRAALAQHLGEEPQGSLDGVKTFCFLEENDFDEIRNFTRQMDERYGLKIHYLTGSFKHGLEKFLTEHSIQAIVLGTRRGDPNAPGQGFYCPSSDGWPAFMRINPILDWNFQEVWSFLRKIQVPYCELYDKGYTSIGGTNNTTPNNALRKEDGTFAPAYLLADNRLERVGRVSVSRQPSDSAGLTRNAAVVVIGDEILSGKVEDLNTNYMCRQLRSIGWRVAKVVFVGDDVDVIANEVRVLSMSYEVVVTSGGVGPTLDDVTMQGVASAMDTELARHPHLEKSIRDYFGDNVTEAHLKMSEVPQDDVELIEIVRSNGAVSPFPLVKCRNVFILPGVPSLLREKFQALKQELIKSELLPPFRNIVLRLGMYDETLIAPILEETAASVGPNVALGSYPVSKQADGAGILISLESKDSPELAVAARMVKEKLPEGVVLNESHQSGAWMRSRASIDQLNLLNGGGARSTDTEHNSRAEP